MWISQFQHYLFIKVYTENRDIYQRINDSTIKRMSHRSVCRWVSKFITGYEHFKDAARQVGPATVTTNNYIVKIQQILQKDAKYTVSQLAQMTNLSLACVEFWEIFKA